MVTDEASAADRLTQAQPVSQLTRLAVFGGLVAVAATGAVLLFALTAGPSLLVDESRYADEPPAAQDRALSDARSDLLVAATALALVSGGAVSAWRLRIVEGRAAVERLRYHADVEALQGGLDEMARRTHEAMRRSEDLSSLDAQAEITRRYESAVTQLGDVDNLGTRLGGVFALERLAVEARERREPWTGEGPEPTDLRHTVERVLAAFARHQSSDPPPPDSDPDTVPTVAPDVAAILAVLGRFGYPPTYDLHGVRAPRVDLRWAVLRWADLRGADLRHADLEGIVLAHADLRGADLAHADLEGADLTDADLRGTTLRECYLKGAFLQRADLRDTDLHRADLGGADLTGVDLSGADLTGAYLRDITTDESTIWPDDGTDPTAG